MSHANNKNDNNNTQCWEEQRRRDKQVFVHLAQEFANLLQQVAPEMAVQVAQVSADKAAFPEWSTEVFEAAIKNK